MKAWLFWLPFFSLDILSYVFVWSRITYIRRITWLIYDFLWTTYICWLISIVAHWHLVRLTQVVSFFIFYFFLIIVAKKTFSFGCFPSNRRGTVYKQVHVKLLVCPGRKHDLPPGTGLFLKSCTVLHLNDCSEFRAVHLIQIQTLFCLLIRPLTCFLTE